MEFQEFWKQRKRMCKRKTCYDCDLFKDANYDCITYISKYPKEAEAYIIKWITEHPLITNKDKFEKTFNTELHASHDNPGYFFFLGRNKPMTEKDAIDWLEAEYKGE